MKKLSLFLVVLGLLLGSSPSFAQNSPSCAQLPNLACRAGGGTGYTGVHDFGGATSLEAPNTVIASLPAAGTFGRFAIISNGASDTDCTVGGGSDKHMCMDDGAAWIAVGDGTGAGGTMTSFYAAGDDNGTVEITDGNTLSIDGDATGIDTDCAATDTCTLSLDLTEIEAATFGGGAGASVVFTYNVSGTDTTATFGSGLLTLSHDLTVSGGDITLGTQSIFSGGDTASLNNIDAINATTETTFEAALDIAGDIAGTGLGSVAIQANAVQGTDISLASEATGDIMYFNGTDWVRQAIGAVGQVLKVSGSSLPTWGNVHTWNEKVCLRADCTATDVPCDCCTGAGAGCEIGTYQLSGTPRIDCNDTFGSGGTILAWSNGILQKCVASAPGINEFALAGDVITPNSGSSVMYVTYEQ